MVYDFLNLIHFFGFPQFESFNAHVALFQWKIIGFVVVVAVKIADALFLFFISLLNKRKTRISVVKFLIKFQSIFSIPPLMFSLFFSRPILILFLLWLHFVPSSHIRVYVCLIVSECIHQYLNAHLAGIFEIMCDVFTKIMAASAAAKLQYTHTQHQ